MFQFAKLFHVGQSQVLFTLTPSDWDNQVPIVKATTLIHGQYKTAIKKFRKDKNGHKSSCEYFDALTEADAHAFLQSKEKTINAQETI